MCSEDASLCFLYSKAFPCWLVGTWTIAGPAELWGWPTAFCGFFIWSELLSSLACTDQYSAKDLCEILWRTLEICLCSFFLSVLCSRNYTCLASLNSSFHLFNSADHRAQLGLLSLLWELETTIRKLAGAIVQLPLLPFSQGHISALLIIKWLKTILSCISDKFFSLFKVAAWYSIMARSRCLK